MRRLRPDQRVKVAQMARFLADQDDRWQRYERIVSAIEDLGGSRLLEQSQERLTALAGELGSFRAAISALAGEIAAAGEANEIGKELKDQASERVLITLGERAESLVVLALPSATGRGHRTHVLYILGIGSRCNRNKVA